MNNVSDLNRTLCDHQLTNNYRCLNKTQSVNGSQATNTSKPYYKNTNGLQTSRTSFKS